MLFISPPFGNYINLEKTTPIRGSFTLDPRPGLFMQILKTLRFSFEKNGWINKIGLRNRGIDYAIDTYKKGEIISLALINDSDAFWMASKIPEHMDIEINVSCPNVEKSKDIYKSIHNLFHHDRKWCILKLSPTTEERDIDYFYKKGFRQFHCSNTIMQKCNKCDYVFGGLSGPSVKPYSLDLTRYIKTKYKDTVVIGGGGIRSMKDVNDYRKAGADHFSVSSLCFNPLMFLHFYLEFTDPF